MQVITVKILIVIDLPVLPQLVVFQHSKLAFKLILVL